MRSKKISLQKLTKTDIKIKKLLALKKITNNDLSVLKKKSEYNEFSHVCTKIVNELEGHDLDKFFQKIEAIADQDTKNELWESNHIRITGTISNLIGEKNRMPSKSEIATKSGLSRQTVHKHLKEYDSHPLYLGQIKQLQIMTAGILARLYDFAFQGDVKAAKLFLDAMGNPNHFSNSMFIQNQNNYIQINGIVLNQESIKLLSSEQLTQIENIVKTVLPRHESKG